MDGFWGVADKIYGEISYSLTPKKKEEEKPDLDPKKSQLSEMEREMVKYVEEKNSKAGLDVNIRIVVNATNQGLALTYLDNIVNSFSQYNLYQYGNSFVVSKSNQQGILNDFIYRNFSFNLFLEKLKNYESRKHHQSPRSLQNSRADF